jgi:hypothetical protein
VRAGGEGSGVDGAGGAPGGAGVTVVGATSDEAASVGVGSDVAGGGWVAAASGGAGGIAPVWAWAAVPATSRRRNIHTVGTAHRRRGFLSG